MYHICCDAVQPLCSVRCSVAPCHPSPAFNQHVAPQLLVQSVASLASILPVGPFEIPALGVESYDSATFEILDARLVNPSVCKLAVICVLHRVHANQPLEVELSVDGFGKLDGADAAASTASWISAHTRLTLTVEVEGQHIAPISVPVSVRLSGGSWLARALVQPACWVNATAFTVISLSFAGRLLPCYFLPATLRVIFNHAPAPPGAVCLAAAAANISALQDALNAGGSTEEMDEVRVGVEVGQWGDGRDGRGEYRSDSTQRLFPVFCTMSGQIYLLFSLHSRLSLFQAGHTAFFWTSFEGDIKVLRTLLEAGANPVAAGTVRGLMGEWGRLLRRGLGGMRLRRRRPPPQLTNFLPTPMDSLPPPVLTHPHPPPLSPLPLPPLIPRPCRMATLLCMRLLLMATPPSSHSFSRFRGWTRCLRMW